MPSGDRALSAPERLTAGRRVGPTSGEVNVPAAGRRWPALVLGIVMAVVPLVASRAADDNRPLPPLRLKMAPALGEEQPAMSGAPMFGRGDRAEGRIGRESTLAGEAELRRSGTTIRADRITYYDTDDEVIAVGNVRMSRQGTVFTGSELRLKIDANEGFLAQPAYRLSVYNGRGGADAIEFLGRDRVAFRNATYTTCRPEEPDWYLRARSLELDQGEGQGTGRSATLYFKDVPIAAAPVFGFSLGDERRSGFLAPTLFLTSRTGPEVLLPYYWNIAPNRDATLFTRVSTRRGYQLGGEYRFMEPWYLGESRFEYTPRDTETDTARYQWSLRGNFSRGGWGGGWNARGVSDDRYFIDYARTILGSADRSLPREIFIGRGIGNWNLLGRISTFQNILEARAAPPPERVPQLLARYDRADAGGFDLGMTVDGTYFNQPLVTTQPVQTLAEGARLVVNPTVSYPWRRPGGFVIPKVGVHAASYRLDRNPGGTELDLNRVVPTFSLDSGLVFERPVRLFERGLTQTLEPRLFYVRTPYREQSGFPVFDTTYADFTFGQLFSENTFVGHDRIADANHLTAAALTRLIDPDTGAERFRFAVGQRRYFSAQRVQITSLAPLIDSSNDWLVAAAGDLGNGMSFDSGLQFSQQNSRVPRATALWRYLPGDGRVFNFGVRYRREQLGQVDTSWRWPISRNWTGLGRVNYSWLDRRIDDATLTVVPAKPGIIEGVLGFEYRRDCWATQFVATRFVTAQGSTTSAFFVQLELTGVARIGSDPFDILRRNIPGYRLPQDRESPPSRYYGYE